MRPIRSIHRLLCFAFAACWVIGGVHAQTTAPKRTGEFLGAKPTEYPPWFKESFLEFSDDVREAAQAGKRIMVMFHQTGCPYCNALVERNLSQKDIEQQVRDQFDVVALNMWGDRDVVSVDGQSYSEKTFASVLKVQFTPTLLFFDENGGVVLRIDGYLPPQKFKLALDYVAGRKEKDMTYREYLALRARPAGTGKLRAEDFFLPPPYDLSADTAGHLVAVFFEQTQCPNCDSLHEGVLKDPETRAVIDRFRSVQLVSCWV
ncbi:MAG: thioredoxin fold domain-containing protein, partial [Gammaproteobacteria bacterium]|nr:thioredoxin fold domain-containing protein [Gammaproteobacteria bacterium]